MKFVIVPVKDLSKAKERLSSVLPQTDRTALAYAMLEDVLIALKGSNADRKFIVTLDTKAIEIAKGLGIEVIEETEQKGESASVDYASDICKEMGASSVLVIPGDAPLITSSDIDFVLGKEMEETPSIVFVPARDDYGTNAILRKPPDAIRSMFGDDSFNKHKAAADEKNIPYESYENHRIGLDIDDPDDLKELMSERTNTKAHDQLMKLNIVEKIRQLG